MKLLSSKAYRALPAITQEDIENILIGCCLPDRYSPRLKMTFKAQAELFNVSPAVLKHLFRRLSHSGLFVKEGAHHSTWFIGMRNVEHSVMPKCDYLLVSSSLVRRNENVLLEGKGFLAAIAPSNELAGLVDPIVKEAMAEPTPPRILRSAEDMARAYVPELTKEAEDYRKNVLEAEVHIESAALRAKGAFAKELNLKRALYQIPVALLEEAPGAPFADMSWTFETSHYDAAPAKQAWGRIFQALGVTPLKVKSEMSYLAGAAKASYCPLQSLAVALELKGSALLPSELKEAVAQIRKLPEEVWADVRGAIDSLAKCSERGRAVRFVKR